MRWWERSRAGERGGGISFTQMRGGKSVGRRKSAVSVNKYRSVVPQFPDSPFAAMILSSSGPFAPHYSASHDSVTLRAQVPMILPAMILSRSGPGPHDSARIEGHRLMVWNVTVWPSRLTHWIALRLVCWRNRRW